MNLLPVHKMGHVTGMTPTCCQVLTSLTTTVFMAGCCSSSWLSRNAASLASLRDGSPNLFTSTDSSACTGYNDNSPATDQRSLHQRQKQVQSHISRVTLGCLHASCTLAVLLDATSQMGRGVSNDFTGCHCSCMLCSTSIKFQAKPPVSAQARPA